MNRFEKERQEKKDWEIGYYAKQSTGLAELACSKESIPENKRMISWRNEMIAKARQFRKRLHDEYDLVLWGQYQVITKQCEPYRSPLEVVCQ